MVSIVPSNIGFAPDISVLTYLCTTEPIYSPPPCGPCYITATPTLLSYTNPVRDLTVALTPLVTIVPNGTAITTGTLTRTIDPSLTACFHQARRALPALQTALCEYNASKSNNSQDLTVTASELLTWEYSNVILTYPSTYLYYTEFTGALIQTQSAPGPSAITVDGSKWGLSTNYSLTIDVPGTMCEVPSSKFVVELPTTTSAASLMFAIPPMSNTAALAYFSLVPSPILAYLDTLSSVRAALGNNSASSCLPMPVDPTCTGEEVWCSVLILASTMACGLNHTQMSLTAAAPAPYQNCSMLYDISTASFGSAAATCDLTIGVSGGCPDCGSVYHITASVLTTSIAPAITAGPSIADNAATTKSTLVWPGSSISSPIVPSTTTIASGAKALAQELPPDTTNPPILNILSDAVEYAASSLLSPQGGDGGNVDEMVSHEVSIEADTITRPEPETMPSPKTRQTATTLRLQDDSATTVSIDGAAIITVSRVGTNVLVGTYIINPGSTQTIDGGIVALASNRVTVAIAELAGPEQGSQFVTELPLDLPQVVTAVREGSNVVIGQQTLTPGAQITINGQTIALLPDSSGLVLKHTDGTKTTVSIADGMSRTIAAGQYMSAVPLIGSGDVLILGARSGPTLQPAHAITYAGHVISLDASGAYVYVDGTKISQSLNVSHTTGHSATTTISKTSSHKETQASEPVRSSEGITPILSPDQGGGQRVRVREFVLLVAAVCMLLIRD